jgi:hypothetical protein
MESNHFVYPLYAQKFIQEADRNEIPYALLPCIERQESGGGRHYTAGTFNPFGWHSDAVAFESVPAGIDFVSYQLGHGYRYAGKSLTARLAAYNPRPAYGAAIESCITTVINEPTQ